jgi:hypothetical protein
MAKEPDSGPQDTTAGSSQRARRIPVSMDGVLIASDGVESPVRVTDLSSEGFRLELTDELIDGEQVQLRLGRETIRGEIRWVRGKEAGGVFLQGPGL